MKYLRKAWDWLWWDGVFCLILGAQCYRFGVHGGDFAILLVTIAAFGTACKFSAIRHSSTVKAFGHVYEKSSGDQREEVTTSNWKSSGLPTPVDIPMHRPGGYAPRIKDAEIKPRKKFS